MPPLSAPALLQVWEQAAREPAQERSLTLLEAARPGLNREQVAALPLGERNRGLLQLREQLFGPQLDTLGVCPHCGQTLEASFSTRQLLECAAEPVIAGGLDVDGRTVHFRQPDSRDLDEAARLQDAAAARRLLVARCLSQADGSALPERLETTVLERMEELDPQLDIRFAMTCAGCGGNWSAGFDATAFLWTELGAWVSRIVGEVHTLASAYGWSESEILALSPLRRQMYLEMVGA